MERHFDGELKELKELLLTMAGLSEGLIAMAVKSLRVLDEKEARTVIAKDKEVDQFELEIGKAAIGLLARHQPMASDLRFITSIMQISTDLERIADLAVDIAERTLELVGTTLVKPLIDIPKLGLLAQKMVKESIDAFVSQNVNLAREVCNKDDEADFLRDAVYQELIELVSKDGSLAPRAIPLLLVARHLERICDHATNIAEDVVYLVKAEVIKHTEKI